MLGNLLKWAAENIAARIGKGELEKAVEDMIEAGRFAVELNSVEVGQTAIAPKIIVDEFGKQFQIDIRATRSA